MSIGSKVTAYQLQIDTQPPAVQGSTMVWTNPLPSNMDPNAAANIPASFSAQLAIWLNFTKPIRGLTKVWMCLQHVCRLAEHREGIRCAGSLAMFITGEELMCCCCSS